MTYQLSTQHWKRLHGEALAKGNIKTYADDFVVEEELGFELMGEGEHHLLWIEKLNTNTAYVAEVLAKFSGIPLRDISYAGRKDKFARTRQYFSVYQGKHSTPDWSSFHHDGIRILQTTRHNKKLRTGALQGNRFSLVVRNFAIANFASLENRMQAIQSLGVPNYYGQQRFGETREGSTNGNLQLGLRMVSGEKIKNRNKRSMAISALRSFLFNEVVSHRIETQSHNTILLGDALQLSGNNSYFLVKADENLGDLHTRLSEQDVFITAPLCGSGKSITQSDAKTIEQEALHKHEAIIKNLANIGLKQERRALMLYPKGLKWTFEKNTLELSFSLPAGCFATAVLREIVNT